MHSPPLPRPWQQRWMFSLFLGLVCVATYAPILQAAFIGDDKYLVVDNPDIRDLRHVPALFVSTPQGALVRNFYRPLMLTSFAIDRAVFGDNPAGFHAVNIALHMLAVWLVFQLLLALGIGDVASAAGAVLFAVHPLQSEVIDIVNYRSASLAAIGLFAGLWCFLRGRARGWTLPRLAALAACYLAAVASKETGVTLPLIMLALDALLPVDMSVPLTVRLRPYLTTACIAAIYLTARAVLCTPSSFSYFGSTPVHEVMLTMTFVEAYALSLLVVPRGLSGAYNTRFLPNISALSDPRWLIAIGLLGLIAALAWQARRRWPLLTLAVLFYFITLTPTTQLLGRLPVIFGERFLYLPLFGLSLGVAALLDRISSRTAERAALALLMAIATLFAMQSRARTREFFDTESSWRVALAVEPNNLQVRVGLAEALRGQGRCTEALTHFVLAMRALGPTPNAARSIFGGAASCYALTGDRAHALSTIETWLAAHPSDPGFRSMQQKLTAPQH